MNDVKKDSEVERQNRKVQNIDHICSTEGCGRGAPYGFKDCEANNSYRWCCADHIGEGDIILSDGSKRFAARGRG